MREGGREVAIHFPERCVVRNGFPHPPLHKIKGAALHELTQKLKKSQREKAGRSELSLGRCGPRVALDARDYTPLGTLIKTIFLISSWVLYKQKFKKIPRVFLIFVYIRPKGDMGEGCNVTRTRCPL